MGSRSIFMAIRRIGAVAALAAVLATGGLAAGASRSTAPVHADAVAVVGMTVADLARSVRFFTEVLDFQELAEIEVSGPAYDRLWGLSGVRARVARLRLGHEVIELVEFVTPKGRPYPSDSRSNDRWFQHLAIVVADMDAAYARVRARVDPISVGGPQTLPMTNPPAAGISAFYFHDPDGHALELIHFPSGKGDPRWQRPHARLFLGIDHTAIGVRATDPSLDFYRDLLGFAVVGESLNIGMEQERLTGVHGAQVRITGLHTRSGLPGIELLDYRAPIDGRDAPADERTNDVMHWYARIVVSDVGAAVGALRRAGYLSLSDVVTLDDARSGAKRAVVVHDRDGHTVELVEPMATVGMLRPPGMLAGRANRSDLGARWRLVTNSLPPAFSGRMPTKGAHHDTVRPIALQPHHDRNHSRRDGGGRVDRDRDTAARTRPLEPAASRTESRSHVHHVRDQRLPERRARADRGLAGSQGTRPPARVSDSAPPRGDPRRRGARLLVLRGALVLA
jgi:catechol 2,3-dioxygenase-like lactoylglutathione lyase family enzyme